MSESDQKKAESPLESERGSTNISERVVSQIVGMAANEVAGVHMGGSASRTSSGLLGNITGSSNQNLGVSAEVGPTETAIDLTMGIDYGRNILEALEEVRSKIRDRIGTMTGLKITELNATINDIVFPEEGDDRSSQESTNAELEGSTGEEEPRLSDRDVSEVRPTSRTHSESESGPVPEEEVLVEEEPLASDETAELKPGESVERQQRSEEESERSTGRSTEESTSGRRRRERRDDED